jgi:hypothetical protein
MIISICFAWVDCNLTNFTKSILASIENKNTEMQIQRELISTYNNIIEYILEY